MTVTESPSHTDPAPDNNRERNRNSGCMIPRVSQSQLRGSFRITRNSLVNHACRRDTNVAYVKEQT